MLVRQLEQNAASQLLLGNPGGSLTTSSPAPKFVSQFEKLLVARLANFTPFVSW
jgi:hypothetical protein